MYDSVAFEVQLPVIKATETAFDIFIQTSFSTLSYHDGIDILLKYVHDGTLYLGSKT